MAKPKKMKVVAKPEDFERQHQTDAGYDIRVPRDVTLYPGEVNVVETKVKVEIPENCVGILAMRSSVGASGVTLAGGIGVIDSGYRGNLKLALVSYKNAQTLFAGERVAQLMIVQLKPVEITFTDKLGESDRGEKGSGSTGKD
jgi:dUTP pyrophosphatase